MKKCGFLELINMGRQNKNLTFSVSVQNFFICHSNEYTSGMPYTQIIFQVFDINIGKGWSLYVCFKCTF